MKNTKSMLFKIEISKTLAVCVSVNTIINKPLIFEHRKYLSVIKIGNVCEFLYNIIVRQDKETIKKSLSENTLSSYSN